MWEKQKIIIIAAVAVIIFVGVGFWYWKDKKPIQSQSVTKEAGKSIGGSIFEKTQDSLQAKIPETNPLKRVIKNPF